MTATPNTPNQADYDAPATPPKPIVKTFIDPDQLAKDLNFDLADLTTAMARHSQLMVYYGQQTVRAKAQYDTFKAAMEIIEAKLDSEHRSVLKEENPKVTEAAIKAAVINDARYKSAQANLIKAKTQHGLAEVAERGFEHRKAMLLQIAQDAAREQSGQLRVTANQTARDRLLDAQRRNAEQRDQVTAAD